MVVLAEHNNSKLASITLNTITAALRFKKPVTVLVAGENCEAVAKQASSLEGVNEVVLSDSSSLKHSVAENVTALLQHFHTHKPFSALLSPAGASGKNILPRLAALLDVQPISDVTNIISDDTFSRPVYAGNIIATFQSVDPVKILTVRPTCYAAAQPSNKQAPITSWLPSSSSWLPSESSRATWVRDDLAVSSRPDLTSARIVVSGGRALKSGENFKILEELADLLGGAVGASRAAVDAGYVSNDYQVGQTGKVVAPDLYIACGISGAIQHLAGMKDSKTIVAINKDPEAPIFQVADYGLVADLFKAVPELTAQVKKFKESK